MWWRVSWPHCRYQHLLLCPNRWIHLRRYCCWTSSCFLPANKRETQSTSWLQPQQRNQFGIFISLKNEWISHLHIVVVAKYSLTHTENTNGLCSNICMSLLTWAGIQWDFSVIRKQQRLQLFGKVNLSKVNIYKPSLCRTETRLSSDPDSFL